MNTNLQDLRETTLLSADRFHRLQVFAWREWGLNLRDDRREVIQDRLQMWARRSPEVDVGRLLQRVIAGRSTPAERLELFDELAVKHTSFLREAAHFECLTEVVVTPRLRGGPRRLRLWSAGCSVGCEPYSLAMTLRERVASLDAWDVRILATDLSRSALHRARSGVYERRDVEPLPASMQARHFREIPSGRFQVSPSIRRLVTFKLLNLVDSWPMQGPFDAIFCRNVLLYQSRDRASDIVRRFVELLAPGGLLVLGCAESLPGPHPELCRVGPSSFRNDGEDRE